MSDKKATIFDIKRYAIHDGPGIRTTVFFKGCPLTCQWCHNPESIRLETQKLHSPQRCINCGSCIENCPENAIVQQNVLQTDSNLCLACGQCAALCPSKANEISGRQLSVSELLAEIKKDVIFFDQSGGGVTFSGGEPLLQGAFLMDILRACGEMGIHRCIDTSAYVKTQTILEAAQHCELFLYDLKTLDTKIHRKFTGLSNERILENLKRLADTGSNIRIRIPLVSGVNDDIANIRASADFIAKLPNQISVDLLKYHHIAAHKSDKLGQERQKVFEAPSDARLAAIVQTFKEAGIDVHLRS